MNHAKPDVLSAALFHAEADGAVGQHHPVALRQLVHQLFVLADQDAGLRRDGAAHQPQLAPFNALLLAAAQLAQADLGAGQISQHAERTPQFAAHAPDGLERGLMLRQLAMRHVQAEHVDARLDQLSQLFLALARRTNGGDDLGSDSAGARSGIRHRDFHP